MADVIVKPAFQSGYTDTGDTTKLGPTSWNAARLFSGGADGQVVARSAASPTGAVWVSPSTPGVHAPSHNTGGLDPITNLSAAVLTSGVLLDARLSANVQMKPIPLADLPASVALKPIPQSDVVNLVSDLALKAPLASPALTGVPTAPTATAGTSTTQLATTAFVQAGLTTAASANHHARHEPGGADAMAVDAAATVGSLRTIGTGPLQAASGDDSRLTDARPALAHHVSHETGGVDALAVLDAGILVSGTLPNARLDANVVVSTSVAVGTFVAIGTTPALQGSIRLNSAGTIFARNVANTGDIRLLRVANDTVTLGAPANPLVIAGTSVAFTAVPVTGPSSLTVSGSVQATDLGTTPLNASNLSSGTVPNARIPVSGVSRLLGRGSANGAGPMEEILLGTGLNIVGNTMNASTATGGVIHAATHQPGGDDPLTNLSASILTSGTLSDLRLTINVLRVIGGYPGGTSTFLRADGNFATLPPTIDLAYLGNYTTPRTYKDGDIVIAADGISYMCVVDGTTTPPEPWPAQTVSTAHHLTHEVGGNDEITGSLRLATLRTAYVDLPEATPPVAPAADTVRLYALDVNGFSFPEMVDSGGGRARPLRDNIEVAKAMEAITRGQLVYISGASGSNEQVRLAKADAIGTMPAVGFALDTAAVNGFVRVLLMGKIPGVNTAAYTEGDRLWVSSTVAGGMQTTSPALPALSQRIGIITRSHATQGEILVTIATIDQVLAHHTSHEPGGTDALTALSATILTSGSLPDARLSANVPLLNVANVFTQPQTFSYNLTTHLVLINSALAADAKRFAIGVNTGVLEFRSQTDAGGLQTTGLSIGRTGNVAVGGNLVVPGAGLLQLGSTTTLYPALRSTLVANPNTAYAAMVEIVSADNSKYAGVRASNFIATSNYNNFADFTCTGPTAFQGGINVTSGGIDVTGACYLRGTVQSTNPIYPGLETGGIQASYYLAGSTTYGMICNTGLYLAYGLWTAQHCIVGSYLNVAAYATIAQYCRADSFWEHGRGAAIGDWSSYTPVLTNPYGGSWTGTAYGIYTFIGHMCYLIVSIENSAINTAAAYLQISTPIAFDPTRIPVVNGYVRWHTSGGLEPGIAEIANTNPSVVTVYRNLQATIAVQASGLYVRLQMAYPIA